jgi:hypothetical protein
MSGDQYRVKPNKDGKLSNQNKRIYDLYLQALEEYFRLHILTYPDEAVALQTLMGEDISTKAPIKLATSMVLADRMSDFSDAVDQFFFGPSKQMAEGQTEYFGGQFVKVYQLLLNTKLIPELQLEQDFTTLLRLKY